MALEKLAVEVLPLFRDEDGSPMGMSSVIILGQVIPTPCEHTHVDGLGEVQPWN